jgi:hypothetical protein
MDSKLFGDPRFQMGLSIMSNPDVGEAMGQGMQRAQGFQEYNNRRDGAKAARRFLARYGTGQNTLEALQKVNEEAAAENPDYDPGPVFDILKNLRAMEGRDRYTPAAIQEYEYFNKLSPDQQDAFLNVRRAPQSYDLGDKRVVRGAMGGIAETYPKGVPPQEAPSLKREQAEATAAGKVVGEAQGAQEKKYIQAPQIEDYLQKAEALLPNATSGGFNTTVRDVQGYFGSPTEGSTNDAQLNIIGAALTAGVPRFEGPQSNLDVEQYRQAAGDLANSKLPVETRMAAIKTIRTLNDKYRLPVAESLPAIPRLAEPPVEGARQAPDGKWYIPDPSRPGKFLEVQP